MRIRKMVMVALLASFANAIAIPNSLAANAEFQNFFFDACVNPSGALAARCAETSNGQGDLSSDSESSLNPSQALSTGDSAVLAAQQNSQEIRERLQGRREDDDRGPRVDIGPWRSAQWASCRTAGFLILNTSIPLAPAILIAIRSTRGYA